MGLHKLSDLGFLGLIKFGFRPLWAYPIGSTVVPFWFVFRILVYRVTPKRNYFGAYGLIP